MQGAMDWGGVMLLCTNLIADHFACHLLVGRPLALFLHTADEIAACLQASAFIIISGVIIH